MSVGPLPAPNAGINPCFTFAVISERIFTRSFAAELTESRQITRSFSVSTDSSVTCTSFPVFRKCPVTMFCTCISFAACCRSTVGPMYLFVVANGRIARECA